MAVRQASVSHMAAGVLRIRWAGLLNGDNGEGVVLPHTADKCAHVYGTFGVGGSISLKGTNKDAIATGSDPILADPQGNAITKTTEGIEQVLENPLMAYPHVTAGDGATSLTCDLIVKGAV